MQVQDDVFINKVGSWIDGYNDPKLVVGLVRFIDDSYVNEDIKVMLRKRVYDRVDAINKNKPSFIEHSGNYYLADDNNHPQVYTTKYAAVGMVAKLKLLGYDVEIVGSVFYRIRFNPSRDFIDSEGKLNEMILCS